MTDITTPDAAVEVYEPAAGMPVVTVRGELDPAGTLRLEQLLDQLLTGPPVCRLVIDLTGVTALAPACLGLLLRLHRRSRAQDVHLVLVGTGHRAVNQPLRLGGLLGLFDIRATLAHALDGSGAFHGWRGTAPSAGMPATVSRSIDDD